MNTIIGYLLVISLTKNTHAFHTKFFETETECKEVMHNEMVVQSYYDLSVKIGTPEDFVIFCRPIRKIEGMTNSQK